MFLFGILLAIILTVIAKNELEAIIKIAAGILLVLAFFKIAIPFFVGAIIGVVLVKGFTVLLKIMKT